MRKRSTKVFELIPSVQTRKQSPGPIAFIPALPIKLETVGSGKGHYDRALIHLKKIGARLIGVGWSLQRLAVTIPADDWDVPLDGFVSQDGLEWFS